MTYLYLAGAIACEIVGTMSLRASDGLRDKRWLPVVIAGYLGAFLLLALTLRSGLGVGVAYGIWAATGIGVTAVLARLLFAEPLTRTMLAGIALISVGVLLIELGGH